MFALVREPLTARQLAVATAGVMAAVALYCVGYTALAGRPEGLVEALAWALVNVAPWLPALEGAKRARSLGGIAASLTAGFAASMLLGWLLDSGWTSVLFESWRRAPAVAAVAALALALRWDRARTSRGRCNPLPLLPGQIDWVRAAGNYVELRTNGRTIVHRTSISAVERELAPHGFVRVHRSTLVRREKIARVRSADVVLHDGTHLKIGKRYRAELEA